MENHDHLLTMRVRKYIEEHSGETHLYVGQATMELMQKYPEYSRREFEPFRQLVLQAFSIVSDSYNLDMVEAPPSKPLAAKPISEPIDISIGKDNEDDSNTSTTNGDEQPAPPEVQANALKRLMEDLPETTAVPKKTAKLNTIPGSGPDSAHEFPPGVGHGGENHHSEDAEDHGNASSFNQQRKYKKKLKMYHPRQSFWDIGGMDTALKELCQILIHIKSPKSYFHLGLLPSKGILLHGPPGCGKTFLARAISGQLKMRLLEVPAKELIGDISNETEERIREVFEQTINYSPCVLFIDDIDAIGGNRQWASKLISSWDNLRANQFGHSVLVIGATRRPDVLDRRLRSIERFAHEIAIHKPSRKERRNILRIQCERLPIDPKLNYNKVAELTPGYSGADLKALVARAFSVAVRRRSMKKFRELRDAREKNMITVILDDDESVEGSGDDEIDEADGDKENTDDNDNAGGDTPNTESPKKPPTNGESPGEPVDEKPEAVEQEADSSDDEYYEPMLAELINFVDHPPKKFADPNFCITLDDFVNAIKVMQPSAKGEGFITVPDTTWDDIGALEKIREQLKLALVAPIKYPERLERLGLNAPSGVLLCGPPGCGKTLLAKAIANEAGINFISVKGPELMNMYLGEGEHAVRASFQRARYSTPCVLFFDEFDSLCPKRSDGGEGNNSGTRMVNQLLTEMDGVEERKGVYILAATNRPDIIDPAILHPGRLDTILYIDFPDQSERAEILKAITKNGKRPLLAEDISLDELAAQTEGYTGEDLAGLIKQASMFSLRQSSNDDKFKLDDPCLHSHHFKDALQKLRPSVCEQDRKSYDELRLKYAGYA
nr:nuclear valosin-containing protein-like [Drosophila takahashii]